MEWRDKIDSFKKIDVRGIQGNFFQGIKKQAMSGYQEAGDAASGRKRAGDRSVF